MIKAAISFLISLFFKNFLKIFFTFFIISFFIVTDFNIVNTLKTYFFILRFLTSDNRFFYLIFFLNTLFTELIHYESEFFTDLKIKKFFYLIIVARITMLFFHFFFFLISLFSISLFFSALIKRTTFILFMNCFCYLKVKLTSFF